MTKPGILLLSMALVSCMLLTACADSFASPARASEGSNQQEPSSPERGSAAVEATEKRELLVRFAVEKKPCSGRLGQQDCHDQGRRVKSAPWKAK